jgi:hypothetical protein
MNRETAEYLNQLMLDLGSRLSDSVGVVKERCSAEERAAYIKPVSHMLALSFDVLDLIHRQFPDLKPPSFRD